MVSQGRIGALIEAKPAERRLLLEEAAGTAGLHARRRETELKLDAAEDNLMRLDDVVATIETQFETLKKQARQAQRYRRLGEHIRRTEALLFHARWRAAEAEAERTAAQLRARGTRGRRGDASAHSPSSALARRQRQRCRRCGIAEAGRLRRVAWLTHVRDALEQELQRVLAARGEAERRLIQLAADLAARGRASRRGGRSSRSVGRGTLSPRAGGCAETVRRARSPTIGSRERRAASRRLRQALQRETEGAACR